MMCPKCGKEMRRGRLFSSKDGAFRFADTVPDALENARTAEGFVEITALKAGGRTNAAACCCEMCRLVLIEY